VEEWQIMIHDKLTINIIFELSQTRTGLADDGNGILLSEHSLHKISPQLRQ
jgi:hypothetical protein